MHNKLLDYVLLTPISLNLQVQKSVTFFKYFYSLHTFRGYGRSSHLLVMKTTKHLELLLGGGGGGVKRKFL